MSSLELRPANTVLGLDIGGTKIAIVEGAGDATILQRLQIDTEGKRPFEHSLPRIAESILKVKNEAERAGRRIVALSVAVAGPLRIDEGVLLEPPNLPGWHDVRLKERLGTVMQGIPVFVEHDGNAGALAEFRFGAGRGRQGLRHLIFLTFGTGMGAGLIINGEVLHGASDTAGEVGHFRMASEGPTLYGKAGSWEALVSGAGMVLVANRMFPHRWSADTPIREVVSAMLNDDPDALAIAREVGVWIGRGMALLVDALNPQLIVLGSLAAVLGERVLVPAREALAQEALPHAVAACEVVSTAFGDRIGDVAALMAALGRPEIVQLLGTG